MGDWHDNTHDTTSIHSYREGDYTVFVVQFHHSHSSKGDKNKQDDCLFEVPSHRLRYHSSPLVTRFSPLSTTSAMGMKVWLVIAMMIIMVMIVSTNAAIVVDDEHVAAVSHVSAGTEGIDSPDDTSISISGNFLRRKRGIEFVDGNGNKMDDPRQVQKQEEDQDDQEVTTAGKDSEAFEALHQVGDCSKNHEVSENSNIVSMTCTIDEGSFTYYYYKKDRVQNEGIGDVDGTDPGASQLQIDDDERDSMLDNPSCQTIFILGVGAAMGSTEYNQLSVDIVTEEEGNSSSSSSILTIVIDDNPNQIKKQSHVRYANLVYKIVTNLDTYIPSICGNENRSTTEKTTIHDDVVIASAAASSIMGTTTKTIGHKISTLATPHNVQDGDDSDRMVIIGGHSASGEAAINSLPLLVSPSSSLYVPSIKGIVGLAPYKIGHVQAHSVSSSTKAGQSNGEVVNMNIDGDDAVIVNIPALYWGFSSMTCAVEVEYAADMAYKVSHHNFRVLYQVQTDDDNFNPMMGGPHCVFSDNGCMKMCNPSNMQWIKNSVAVTISTFIAAIRELEAAGVEQGSPHRHWASSVAPLNSLAAADDDNGGSRSSIGRGNRFTRDAFEKVLPPNTKLFVNEDKLVNEKLAVL